MIPGFDDRPLYKLRVGALTPEDIEKGFPGIEVVSQEDGGFALVFATEAALSEFEARLSSLMEGGQPSYKNILFALQSVDAWTPQDRMGWALRLYGFPDQPTCTIDVELWPLRRGTERAQLTSSFEKWVLERGGQIKDGINLDDLIQRRLEISRSAAEEILRHRDVRLVDLPPRLGLKLDVLQTDIQTIDTVPPPNDDAPLVAVLDSGITSNHPLLAPAVADAQGFLDPDRDASDANGHGTMVAGIALYDDVEEGARAGSFVPQLRLLSGRILDDNAESDARFIENVVEEAVRYFHTEYGCRVYTLCYGDLNKPYRGGRVRGLAYTLDSLSRELDVLFIVPTGNLAQEVVATRHPDYYKYLLEEDSRLLDPAPALNVLTIGSIVRWDRAVNAQRYPDDINDIPIAQREFPSPFTRCGGSVRNAIKPELVAYGGNIAYNARDGRLEKRCLGELSTSRDFATGKLLTADCGTSFAAPHVAHQAARLLDVIPNASQNLLRALLVANADIPPATLTRIVNKIERERLVGYGVVDSAHLYRSTEEHLILISEAALIDKHNHFYEIPVPDSFFAGQSRRRELTVALAHCPPVRTTRIDYKGSRFQFRLVKAATLDDAVAAFDRETKGEIEGIKEAFNSNLIRYGASKRGCGTVQASTWAFRRPSPQRFFVVVTRNDQAWATDLVATEEKYALVIRISDRENAQARLYSEVQAQLKARARARM